MASTSPSAAVVGPGAELGGRYRLIRSIGRGSSATVFEAEDSILERRVAVKVLHRELSGDKQFLDRFVQEARSAAALSHSNVMLVHDWGEDESEHGGTPFLVTELLTGGSLRDMLDQDVVCSPSQVIAFGIDACRALHYAHGQGLVHRDVTPANLMFTGEGDLKIADFGLARALADSGWTEPGKTLVGTARYSSPEQAQGHRLTAASDVYSLGLILIEALSGSAPFSADTLLGTLTARVESDVPIPDVPEALASVLRSMTQRDPAARPTSHDAGVGLLGSAKGMPRPAALPLVVLPDELDEPEATAPAEVFEPSSKLSSSPGVIAGTRATNPEGGQLAAVDPDADPDMTVVDLADRTTIAEIPVVDTGDEPARRWPVLLLAIAVVASIGWFGWQQFSGGNIQAVAVPDVGGLPLEEALAELGDTWVLEEKLERDASVEQGSVVRTEPVAGELLDEGTELSYWVSLGLPLVRVPEEDLVGRSQAQAIGTLEALELSVGDVELINSEEVGEGNVISVSAEALELPIGASVDLVVSLGPQDRVIPEFDETTDADQLVSDLEEAGLGVARLDEFNDEVEEGVVVSITPVPGTQVDRGSQVEVVVSTGPTPVAIPATSGLSLTDTLDLLDAAGFLAQLVSPEGEDGTFLASCAVIGTDPPSPTELQPGNTVQVLMSDCT